ncbi:deoxyguanosinetriphosphate triphosphohydrolase family protein [Mariniphaga sp.]|uniref:deoxyguanosinetriphosphate triphosphohydrolase family protein n=1 Tax=Mariniphaga sp. TaxID=1954475 RepID=UPI00356693E7
MKTKKVFKTERANNLSPNWGSLIKREKDLYLRTNDIRSEFARDYTRILHSNGYRRLKTKTQVFFATKNDHICTRIEHVNHVASVSSTIAKQLGLNDDLVNAIAIGHDIGHAPFGHHGESVIRKIMNDEIPGNSFWHEKNSLFFVDHIETLTDSEGYEQNLNLTYAVRDGIISHCGEVNQDAIYPRTEYIDLEDISKSNEYQPYTWEGCVVKIADKIAYLGRDIEDAMFFKILNFGNYKELTSILEKHFPKSNLREINNGILIHGFITNLLKNSSPENGIRLSPDYLGLMNDIKNFNYSVIYKYWRIESFKDYATVVISAIFKTLMRYLEYRDYKIRIILSKENFPVLSRYFYEWLLKYSNIDLERRDKLKFKNKIIYDALKRESYVKCCLDFISGMTDNFALKVYHEIISF